ncbi:MAG: molybdopterin-dependent oxidoreductase [Deltaproteobacteria bacterium]|nr:molybdopterin-dependent oxidoreductase [Deltaproteobacteria bacterium]
MRRQDESTTAGFTRRAFLLGTGAGTLALALSCLREGDRPAGAAAGTGAGTAAHRIPAPVAYSGFEDVYRSKWTWDRVAKGTHTRANCIAACSWDVFVKDGVVWREEQAAVYEPPRPDVPDLNPRGCQKGACYSDLQASAARVLHPLKRVGARGEGRWKRVSWDDALTEIADGLIDAAVAQGTEAIIYDHGTTNAGYGPETSGEVRFAEAVNTTILDSWSGVGDMPMGAVQTWGMYNCEGTADDWFRSDYIVVWIGNPTYTRIPEMHFMHEARYRGAQLVVIAPDLSATSVHADLWIPVRPETDAAFGLAAARILVEEGLYDAAYVREQTDLPLLVRDDTQRFLREADVVRGGKDDRFYFWDEAAGALAQVAGAQGDDRRSIALGPARPALEGAFTVALAGGGSVRVRPVFARLREQLAEYDEAHASAITGVAPSVIQRFARELAAANTAMISASWGSCKHHHSDLFQRAMILLMALTGNQGKPGGGMRIAAWWGLDGLNAMTTAGPSFLEILKIIPKAVRGLTARDYETIFTDYSNDQPNAPLMPFLYVHGGYREMWSRPDLIDPALPRGMEEYMKLAIERGWTKIHPAPDRTPKAYIFTGSNPLRRWPAPQIAHEKLWPKLDLIVAVNFRMSTSARHADFVLPAAGYYEKHGIKYAQSYLPYIVLSDQAVTPLGESKSEWEIFGRLTERIATRAKERGIGPVRGFRDRPLDLTKTYDRYTGDGHFDPHDPMDPVKLIDDIMSNSPSVGNISGEEALRVGAVRIIGPARPTPIYATYTDYDPKDTHWPHRWFVDQKQPWPTLTGRQQFYLDHEWYLEAGEALPVHKDHPQAKSPYPLRINGGHTRWSIHAIWRDHDLMLRLQRGQPVCFLSPVDCAPRGISDEDMVRVYNDAGEFESMAKLSPRVQPGEVIIYHAWEPYQFKGWKGQQEPVVAPWKPIHLAGGYGHLHYRMFYGSPSHSPRSAPVEVERVKAA